MFEDLAEVVELSATEVVSVVEDVFEEVWEALPEGGFKRTLRKVGEVVKQAVKIVVKIGEAFVDFVVDTLEKASSFFDMIWQTIKAGIEAALQWLADLFAYTEILKTAKLLEASVVAGLDVMVRTIPTEGDVKGMFNDLRLSLEKATGLDLDAQEVGDEEDQPEREIDPDENFVSHHAASGTFEQSVGAEATADSGDSEDGVEVEDGVSDKLTEVFAVLQGGGSINSVASVLADGLLDILEEFAAAAMGGVASALEGFRDWLAGGGVVYIPVISEMYELITGDKLKFAKALFFLVAIPATYACKGVYGKWPSQMISQDLLSQDLLSSTKAQDLLSSTKAQELLSSTKDAAVTQGGKLFGSTSAETPVILARSLPDSSGSSAASNEVLAPFSDEEPETDEPTSAQITAWGVLGIFGKTFTAIGVIAEGAGATRTSAYSGVSPDPGQDAPSTATIWDRVAPVSSVFSLLLNMFGYLTIHARGKNKYDTVKGAAIVTSFGLVAALSKLGTMVYSDGLTRAIERLTPRNDAPSTRSRLMRLALNFAKFTFRVTIVVLGIIRIIEADDIDDGDTQNRLRFQGVEQLMVGMTGLIITPVDFHKARSPHYIVAAYGAHGGVHLVMGMIVIVVQTKAERQGRTTFPLVYAFV